MEAAAAPAHLCTRCRTNLWDTELAAGRWVCGRCEQTAFDQLRALPGLFRRIDQTGALMKGSSSGDLVSGSSSGSKPPLKLGPLTITANGGAVTLLQAIEDSWRSALGWSAGETRHHSDIDGATKFLINQLGWACSNYPEIAEDLKTIKRLHERCVSIDTGEPLEHRFQVHCSSDDCDGRMAITMTTRWATCPDCSHQYERDHLMRLDSQYGPNTIRQTAA
jgi:hypothetical protein